MRRARRATSDEQAPRSAGTASSARTRPSRCLQRAAERPSHAYLLVGPPGSGVEDAARCFAACRARAGRRPRVRARVARGAPRRRRDRPRRHPDPRRGRPDHPRRGLPQPGRGHAQGDPRVRGRAPQRAGCQQAAEDARGASRHRAHRARHLGRRPAPPDDPLALPAGRLRLPRLGGDPRRAARQRRRRARGSSSRPGWAAVGSTGHAPSPARSSAVRDAFADAARAEPTAPVRAPPRTSPKPKPPCRPRSRSSRSIRPRSSSVSPPSSRRAGYPDRVVRTQVRRLADQHKRAHRHARTELLVEGITALETVYRDALAGPDAPAPQRRSRPAAPRAALVHPRARRLPRGPSGTRRVRPQRDPPPRAPLPPPPRRPALSARQNSGGAARGRTGTLTGHAGVAQTAEQLTRNEQAKGSSPFSGSTCTNALLRGVSEARHAANAARRRLTRPRPPFRSTSVSFFAQVRGQGGGSVGACRTLGLVPSHQIFGS